MFVLPSLPYDYKALEPWIDEETMHIHHDKHHAAYVDNLNKLLEGFPDMQNHKIEELLQNVNKLPEKVKQGVIKRG